MIGPVAQAVPLSGGSITLSGLTAGRVVYAGTGGLLSTDAGLTYDAGTDTLGVGPINAAGNVQVNGGHIIALTGNISSDAGTVQGVGGLIGPSVTRASAGTLTLGGGSNDSAVQVGKSGGQIGVFGVTPASRPSAYTQTYSTATRTHSNPTATTLTHAVGTADGTVADVGSSFNQTTLNNNFRECSDRINQLIADVANIKQVANQILDDLQLIGWLQ